MHPSLKLTQCLEHACVEVGFSLAILGLLSAVCNSLYLTSNTCMGDW